MSLSREDTNISKRRFHRRRVSSSFRYIARANGYVSGATHYSKLSYAFDKSVFSCWLLEFFRENLYLGEVAPISLSLLKSDSWAITFNGIVSLLHRVFSCSSSQLSPFAVALFA